MKIQTCSTKPIIALVTFICLSAMSVFMGEFANADSPYVAVGADALSIPKPAKADADNNVVMPPQTTSSKKIATLKTIYPYKLKSSKWPEEFCLRHKETESMLFECEKLSDSPQHPIEIQCWDEKRDDFTIFELEDVKGEEAEWELVIGNDCIPPNLEGNIPKGGPND